MSSFKKVAFQPYEEEEETVTLTPSSPQRESAAPKKKGNYIMNRAIERQRKLLRLILKLASVQGYNDLDHIRLENGSFMTGSDIVPLIMYALSPGKVITGLKEFVDLLYFAKVTPEMVVNENVKAMLQKLYDSKPATKTNVKTVQIETQPKRVEEPEFEVEFANDDIDVDAEPIRRTQKRKRDEPPEENEPLNKRPTLKARYNFRSNALRENPNWDDQDSDVDDSQ
ncbi:hypothetical protein HDE_06233 [Halotydeus destructor]|nr:hypothetical protein HDE_06233 [Halotydeus destructor]